MLSVADIHVLHGESLPLEDNMDYIMNLACVEPKLILEPAFDWWARKHAADMLAYADTERYKAGAPKRRALWQQRADKLREGGPSLAPT